MSCVCSAVIVLLVNTEGVVSLPPPISLLWGQAAGAYSLPFFGGPASPCESAYQRLFTFSFPSEVEGVQIWVAYTTCAEPSLRNETVLPACSLCELHTWTEAPALERTQSRSHQSNMQAPFSW